MVPGPSRLQRGGTYYRYARIRRLDRDREGEIRAAKMVRDGLAVAFRLRVTNAKLWCKNRRTMGSPQDPRARHREKARRARKNAFYDAKKAVEAQASLDPKKPAAAIAKSAK
ncbi:MAG: hypothetical protein ABW133_18295 [Polyangiaceae bacterium]